ncbi:unnamed protein product [Cladocopium goreaui]|uniref:Uncharacterized protein n=1 Tax=Cladocopium goreaui TaxID=2562237 RepID=A0A9P1G0C7_9DINO|nr:unnamed protein product [Cladocopium goreaui]
MRPVTEEDREAAVAKAEELAEAVKAKAEADEAARIAAEEEAAAAAAAAAAAQEEETG